MKKLKTLEKKKIGKETDSKQKKEITKKSDKILIVAILVIFIFIASFLVALNYRAQQRPKTIDELHQLNLEKGLSEEQGYVYNRFSFVKIAGLWHTQIQSESGRVLYDISFHFSPKELEDLKIKGRLNDKFTNATDIYLSINPLSKDPHVVLALTELSGNLMKSFAKKPIVACDRGETLKCGNKTVITCENKEEAIIHFRDNEKTKVVFGGNCIEIYGRGSELVRAVDRILFRWYGIME